ncbi:MAG: pseudouridine synthase [Candidatus Zambryskibacteria bacterium]|nr:pseudouridine synthase [Candidatus Zambryskibacteria bacterium]
MNKYLAEEKHSTRRGADELVSQGTVFINGRLAKLGEKVNEGDKVEVRYRAGKKKKLIYLAYNKPRGVVTHSADENEEEITGKVATKGVFPVGRLDKDSSGLIILTNDGRITERLLSPNSYHEKEYVVTTKDKLRASFKQKMESGVRIGEELTRPCKVEILGEKKFKIILTEGKNRQIRRMCAALFQEVDTLKRVRVMNIEIDSLKENETRNIERDELKVFLGSLGLSETIV